MPETPERPPDLVVTERLRLERLRSSHAPALFATVTRTWDTLHAWMPWALEPPTLEGQQEFTRSSERTWEDGSDRPYAMVLAGDLVGMTGLHRRGEPETLEIGYWVEVAQTGQGLVTESTRALTDVALGGGAQPGLAGIEEVVIHCDVDNVASAGVPRRLGFTLTGIREVAPVAPSETGRQQIWRMQRRDWPTARQR